MIIRLGDKEVDYNPDFKFYITTKLSNPHYAPEISTKTTIVNFAVKEQGLEAQLLGIVVRKERPELEESKDKLVVNIASSKKKLADLEDEILRFSSKHCLLLSLLGITIASSSSSPLSLHLSHSSPSLSPSPGC